jgi:hypothetical protein
MHPRPLTVKLCQGLHRTCLPDLEHDTRIELLRMVAVIAEGTCEYRHRPVGRLIKKKGIQYTDLCVHKIPSFSSLKSLETFIESGASDRS